MGLSPFKSCMLNASAPAPNPDPSRWQLLKVEQFDDAYVLTVRYLGCTNFEGVKVMVFRGVWTRTHGMRLDPHFSEATDSPIARFRPDDEGRAMAVALARAIGNVRFR